MSKQAFIKAISATGAAVALFSMALPAAASNFNAGTLSSTPYTVSATHIGSFSDIVNFSLDQSSSITGSLVTLDLVLNSLSFLHISSPQLKVFNTASPLTPVLIGTTGFSSPPVLATGNYFLSISGVADGLAGGSYLFGLAAVPTPMPPVPEPETWLMFAAGLAAIGSITRRRWV